MSQNETTAIIAGGVGAGIGMGLARLVPIDGVVALLIAALFGAVIALVAFYFLTSSTF